MNTNKRPVILRKGTIKDAAGIARVQVDSWRTTYRGLMPDHVLDNMSYQVREEMWRTILGGSDRLEIMIVAERKPGAIIGFASGGNNRGGEKEFSGELAALYILQEGQGQGIGRRLVVAFAQELVWSGMNSMIIWALSTNTARGFYERIGGRLVGEKALNIGGAHLAEVGYGWANLQTWLAQQNTV